jgi:hypothetical protein
MCIIFKTPLIVLHFALICSNRTQCLRYTCQEVIQNRSWDHYANLTMLETKERLNVVIDSP